MGNKLDKIIVEDLSCYEKLEIISQNIETALKLKGYDVSVVEHDIENCYKCVFNNNVTLFFNDQNVEIVGTFGNQTLNETTWYKITSFVDNSDPIFLLKENDCICNTNQLLDITFNRFDKKVDNLYELSLAKLKDVEKWIWSNKNE